MMPFLIILTLLATATGALGAPCNTEDFETRLSSESECLLMRRYGSIKPTTMIVWIHGNVTTGGPASSHFRIAQKTAADFAAENVLSVALVRHGYPDGTGASSSGSDYGRADNWPREIIADLARAIERLRLKFKPDRVIIAGHSGGAAITAVLIGMKPQLAEGAVLIACPCDLAAWRLGRKGGAWFSENPMQWLDKVSPVAKVIALTGSHDSTTLPGLAKSYIEGLRARGIDAVFELIPDTGHIDLLGSLSVSDAIARLLRQ